MLRRSRPKVGRGGEPAPRVRNNAAARSRPAPAPVPPLSDAGLKDRSVSHWGFRGGVSGLTVPHGYRVSCVMAWPIARTCGAPPTLKRLFRTVVTKFPGLPSEHVPQSGRPDGVARAPGGKDSIAMVCRSLGHAWA